MLVEEHFRVQVSKDRLEAELVKVKSFDNDFSVTEDDLNRFLKKEKITYGLKIGTIAKVAKNIKKTKFPILIAEGTAPKNGHDAYLVNEIEKEEQRERLSFRDVTDIPSVKNGQLLATVIPETPGTDGRDVYGNNIKAKDGKPLRIRAGKNVLFHLKQFYSTADGQVSITNRAISVNPVYEILGDLDMKTGNIDFIGNVVIRGNVPTGYTIKADGDIKIYGLVEGAHLKSGGSIVISGGISGEKRAIIEAGANVKAAYINQAKVDASQDVIVTSAIMHSNVTSGGIVNCETGSIIGGEIQAATNIVANEVGNHLFTKTVLQLGSTSSIDEKEQALKAEIKQLTENIKKLTSIEQKLSKAKQLGKLNQQQLLLLSKQKATMNKLTEQLFDKDEELKELEEAKREIEDLMVCVRNIVYPNSHIRFGRYAKVIQTEHQNARFYFRDGEIHFEPFR